MPAGRLDGRLWARLVAALRPWLHRALAGVGARGAPRAPEAPARAPGGDQGRPRARPGPAPLPPPASSPLPLAPPPLPETGLGPYARVAWSVRWRPPLLRVRCPRCQEPLALPLWRVLYQERVSCDACALSLARAGDAALEAPPP